MEQIHSLLKRQVKKFFGDPFRIPEDWRDFITAVNNAYLEFDMDRVMLERSLDLSSQELLQANSEMRAIFQAIPDLLFRLDKERKILDYKAGTTGDLIIHHKELIGKHILDVPLKQIGEQFGEALEQVQKSNSITCVEYSVAAQEQPLFFEARLVPLVGDQVVVIIRNISERKQAENALKKREEAQRFFSERLTRVLDTINTLSKIKSFDELCRRSVELAIDRFGFDRVGLCFFSEDQQFLLGVYGTDEMGHLRNEKHIKRPIEKIPTVTKLLENKDSVVFFKKVMLYDDKLCPVGIGNHAVTRLWNGEKIIGIYAVDNLIRKNPITEEDMKVLNIYGTAMGHLFTLKMAENKIHKMNEDLERRVMERTIQLEATNKELEAFSYSVSHDLRAPLRAMDGFSLALLEDYHEKLDEEGKDFLQRIRAGSQHMGRLIDDLLNLSRLTRSQMHFQKVDLSGLVEALSEELRQQDSDRKAEFLIEKNLSVMGDPSLLKVMIWNLMDNAWKFTSRKPEAKIEFGSFEEKRGRIYYIRDNGIGFDMNYSGHLFEAFHRQHNDFEGTGIGLTTVQRIIHRHGGRIWAEGKMNEGATFYFTLDNTAS